MVHFYFATAAHFMFAVYSYHLTGAVALNNHGQVVGSGSVTPDDDPHASRALLWQGDTVLDLNDLGRLDPGWVLTGAVDINDAGQILVNARPADLTHIQAYRGDLTRAFLLTPYPGTLGTNDTATEPALPNTR